MLLRIDIQKVLRIIQKARSLGLKGGRISPSGVYSSQSKDGGFHNKDLRFDTDLFDLVKGDLISEGLTDSEASRMMLENAWGNYISL